MTPRSRTPVRKPANLHISHSRGGGTARFIEDFAAADELSRNLVLESFGTDHCFGIGLRLRDLANGRVLESWVLQDPVTEVRLRHEEQSRILESVCDEYDVGHVVLSSLIGQSLDVFRIGLPVTRVYHDYFPECPAIHLYRDGVCTSCTSSELGLCVKGNAVHDLKASPAYYEEIRQQCFEEMAAAEVTHVAPSRSVLRNLRKIDKRFRSVDFEVIEHGIRFAKTDLFGGAKDGRRLRVGLLGFLGWQKGLEIIRRQFGSIRAVADVHFIGAQDPGLEFAERWGSHFVHHYSSEDLPEILEESRLDVILFLSTVPETFSYLLSEAWCFCIPPAARKLGALGDRIREGENGFLLGLEDREVVNFLLDVDRERSRLREVSARLKKMKVRTAEEAVRDYYQLRAVRPPSSGSMSRTSPSKGRAPKKAE